MICNKCNSEEVIKDGKMYNLSTVNQRFYCKNCGHVFLKSIKITLKLPKSVKIIKL